MKSLSKIYVLAILFLLPGSALAVTTLQEILLTLGGLINTALPIVVSLALFAFFWGLAMYLFGVGGNSSNAAHSGYMGAPSTASKRDGRAIMVMGVISLFVIFSVWGLVNILQNTFGIDGTSNTVNPPVINNPYD